MKIIVTGATGTAGSEVLRQSLENSSIEKVCVLSRKDPGITHPKLKVILHNDFLNYSDVLAELKDFDACLWCLGVSQNAVSKEEYIKITYDYAIAAAKAMATIKPNFVFCFLSGQGADSKEKSRIIFARIKGKTENALLALGAPKIYNFRPGYIHAINGKPKIFVEKLFAPFTGFMYRFIPGMLVSTVELANGMLNVAKNGFNKTTLENNDIRNASLGKD